MFTVPSFDTLDDLEAALATGQTVRVTPSRAQRWRRLPGERHPIPKSQNAASHPLFSGVVRITSRDANVSSLKPHRWIATAEVTHGVLTRIVERLYVNPTRNPMNDNMTTRPNVPAANPGIFTTVRVNGREFVQSDALPKGTKVLLAGLFGQGDREGTVVCGKKGIIRTIAVAGTNGHFEEMGDTYVDEIHTVIGPDGTRYPFQLSAAHAKQMRKIRDAGF